MAFYSRGLWDRLSHTRRHLAAFVGADPESTALVANATAAVEAVFGSLDLEPGDEVLLTDHGYGAVRFAAERLGDRTGATVREVTVPLDAGDDEVIGRITGSVRARTRLVVIDHVASTTAKLLPVERLVASLHERGVPVLVDAAHAPGMLPVDVTRIGADFWLGNLHKWALTSRPTALLAVSATQRRRMRPVVVSWRQPEGSRRPRSSPARSTTPHGWRRRPACICSARSDPTGSAPTTTSSPPMASASSRRPWPGPATTARRRPSSSWPEPTRWATPG